MKKSLECSLEFIRKYTYKYLLKYTYYSAYFTTCKQSGPQFKKLDALFQQVFALVSMSNPSHVSKSWITKKRTTIFSTTWTFIFPETVLEFHDYLENQSSTI